MVLAAVSLVLFGLLLRQKCYIHENKQKRIKLQKEAGIRLSGDCFPVSKMFGI
jgi:hypothetical protein